MTIVIFWLKRPENSDFQSLCPIQWRLLRSGLENRNKAECRVLPDCSSENILKKKKRQKTSQIYVKAWSWLQGGYAIKLNRYYGLRMWQKLPHSSSLPGLGAGRMLASSIWHCAAPAVQHGTPTNVSCLSTGRNARHRRQMHRLPAFWQ